MLSTKKDRASRALSKLTTPYYSDSSHLFSPHKHLAACRAKYVRMISAPARRRHIKDSIITLCSSIILRAPPALIIEYSPDTWYHEDSKVRERWEEIEVKQYIFVQLAAGKSNVGLLSRKYSNNCHFYPTVCQFST